MKLLNFQDYEVGEMEKLVIAMLLLCFPILSPFNGCIIMSFIYKR